MSLREQAPPKKKKRMTLNFKTTQASAAALRPVKNEPASSPQRHRAPTYVVASRRHVQPSAKAVNFIKRLDESLKSNQELHYCVMGTLRGLAKLAESQPDSIIVQHADIAHTKLLRLLKSHDKKIAEEFNRLSMAGMFPDNAEQTRMQQSSTDNNVSK